MSTFIYRIEVFNSGIYNGLSEKIPKMLLI